MSWPCWSASADSWQRGTDLWAASAFDDGDATHAALNRPTREAWSYFVVSEAEDIASPNRWRPLEQTGPGLYRLVQRGEGKQRYFIRHDYAVDRDGLTAYWNHNADAPATEMAQGAVLAVFTPPQAGRYQVQGVLRFRGWGVAEQRRAEVRVMRQSAGRTETLGAWAIPDGPTDNPQDLADLGTVPALEEVRLNAQQRLVFALEASPMNYRGIQLLDGDVTVRRIGGESSAPPAEGVVLAQRCLSLIDLDRPELAEVKRDYEAGRMLEAMQRYQALLMQRLAGMSADVHLKLWLFTPNTTEDLKQGYVTYAHYGQPSLTTRSFIGLPGSVEWDHQPENGYLIYTRDLATMFWASRLAESFVDDRDDAAAALWAGYWGDLGRSWLTTQRAMERNDLLLTKIPKRSILWPSRSLLYYAWRIENFFNQLLTMAPARPDALALALPAEDLAAILTHMVTFEIPGGLERLGRHGGAPNQRRDLAMSIVTASVVLQDFRNAEAWLNAGLVEVDRFLARETLPDGTALEQSLNYNKSLPPNLDALRIMLANLPASPETQARLAQLEQAANDRWSMIHSLIRPDGRLPSIGKSNPYRAVVPWPAQDRLSGLATSSAIHAAVTGDRAGKGPPFHSVYFPFGGYATLRTGWSATDHYACLKNSRPGLGHRRQGGNGLELWAFGQPLFVSSGAEQYSEQGNYKYYFDSTIAQNSIAVDGYTQQIGDASPEDLPYDTPIPARFLTHPLLDFIEGRYDRPYGGWNFKQDGSAKDPATLYGRSTAMDIDDVEHLRQVLFLREVPMWIVVDRMTAVNQHTYTQSWCLPPSREPAGVQPDGVGRSVSVSRQGALPRIDVRHVGVDAADLEYETFYGIHAPNRILGWSSKDKGDRTYDFDPAVDLHTTWSADGTSTLVTAIAASQDDASAFAEFTPHDTADHTGFDATLADGRAVAFRASRDGGAVDLGLAGVDGPYAAALVVTPADGGPGWRVVLPASAGDAGALVEPSGETVPIAMPSGFEWATTPEGMVPRY
ncbi:MAG: heparinase II/III family protein [Planctomycetota bacterium]